MFSILSNFGLPSSGLGGAVSGSDRIGSSLSGSVSGIDGTPRLKGRVDASAEQDRGQDRIYNGRPTGSTSVFQAFPILLATMLLIGLVAAFKGVDRDGDLMLFGGTAVAWVGAFGLTLWLLLHLPLSFILG
jgi:hypothetical protein